MLPQLTKLENVGDADRFEYISADGKVHKFIISNAEQASDGRDLWHLVKEKIDRIEGRNVE